MTNSKRNDNAAQTLRDLYGRTSKHSNYQVLPGQLRPYFSDSALHIKSRHEQERLDYILANVDVRGKRVMDIGGNTGFFTFEMLRAGAESVTYYEGNTAHANFVREAARLLNLSDRVAVNNDYFKFTGSEPIPRCDVCLLLNVLHHVGDDYGDGSLSIERAKGEIKRSLHVMTQYADTLVFQLGFNWKGDRTKGLFANGTKRELVEFVGDCTAGHWKIAALSVPETAEQNIIYRPLSTSNEARRDDLGEFLNRPIFILKKLK